VLLQRKHPRLLSALNRPPAALNALIASAVGHLTLAVSAPPTTEKDTLVGCVLTDGAWASARGAAAAAADGAGVMLPKNAAVGRAAYWKSTAPRGATARVKVLPLFGPPS